MFHKLYKKILPDVCCLCDSRGLAGLDLCEKCHTGLPHNHNYCLQCAIPLGQKDAVCGRCLSQPSGINHAIIPYLYRPPIDYMIKRLKFSAETKYSRLVGELLADAVKNQKSNYPPDILVPVPIHQDRLLERGFNQAEMIARTAAQRLDLPIDCEMVQRSSLKLSQSKLSAREREANIKRAFEINTRHVERLPIEGLHVAIVDDVYTTGATTRAIARHLRKAGASTISIWAVARTP